METVNFNVPSLSCSACTGKITEDLKTLKGIKNVDTDLKSQMVKIDYNPDEIKPQDIKSQIYQMGFEVF
ncbi:heavy-metal-associated domain-containing protein [Pseudobacteroides cellulosolvens]|uniref:Heavy metal transport/detoxification protein n=1 Tax=Pseudobacteroides cellulosolvens ATCC 35603 = DSM 2933 TaxID=398512 RepID=A0A0L6JV50_9FIRM|nr:heavy metal-associated domain-containing protein [Pseudobacteroides cellulosolvens]KNY29716.1 Heavy metal transport/detoxification protein [Pseudobacteroides cellulosolvens ATCC 35603 = DSM 2933]